MFDLLDLGPVFDAGPFAAAEAAHTIIDADTLEALYEDATGEPLDVVQQFANGGIQ